MTLEELQNGLGVPVSMEAYARIDSVYLSQNYNNCGEFIRSLCAALPTREMRQNYVRTMHKYHNEEL